MLLISKLGMSKWLTLVYKKTILTKHNQTIKLTNISSKFWYDYLWFALKILIFH